MQPANVPFLVPVIAKGNIEDWLHDLLLLMQATMKKHCQTCGADIIDIANDISGLRGFVDSSIPQFALLGIQFLWKADLQSALENCKTKKTIMKDTNNKQAQVLTELSFCPKMTIIRRTKLHNASRTPPIRKKGVKPSLLHFPPKKSENVSKTQNAPIGCWNDKMPKTS